MTNNCCSVCGIKPFERRPDGTIAVVFIVMQSDDGDYYICRACREGGPAKGSSGQEKGSDSDRKVGRRKDQASF